jgi:parallel beta-helix repeat protein
MFFSGNRAFFRESNMIPSALSSKTKRVKNMKRQVMKAILILIILLSIILTINVQVSKASRTLFVPDEYPTITSAIDHAIQGDTISVRQGFYFENIRINKSIILLGEDNKNTFIIGNIGLSEATVLTLAASDIKVSGFTIQSTNSTNPTKNALGINIQGNKCTIIDNILRNNYFGIFSACQSSTTITNNTITANIKDGIRFYSGTLNNISYNNIIANIVSGIALGGYSNTVIGNNLQSNFRGLGLGASNSIVFNNNLESNTESGLFLSGSKNIITANRIAGNKYGVYITTQGAAPRANELYQNNFVKNINNAYGNSSYLVEKWDNGASDGNYWSDYLVKYPNAVRNVSSGLGDTPYGININNIDNYPLLEPFDISNPGKPPVPMSSTPVTSSGVVALWTFDNIALDGVIPDLTGNNPAILGSTVGNISFIPEQVQGKFGQALRFNGSAYAFVPPSASLQTLQDVTIDAWINIQEIKDVAYNNIIVECIRDTLPQPTRTLGLAINGETPQNSSSPPIGAIRGYVMTQNGVLNEISTKEPVLLKQWIHVVFTRSTISGMHIYVNGEKQEVILSSGVTNPTGSIEVQNELYIGHDSITQIDELQITNKVEPAVQPLWIQWWVWAIIIISAGVVGSALIYYKKKHSKGIIYNIKAILI